MGDVEARLIRLRYAGTCVRCARQLQPGVKAWWNPADHRVACEGCGLEPDRSEPTSDIFVPGTSAQRMADKLTERKQAEFREAGWLKKASIARRNAPSRARSWNRGAEGERLVGSLLNQLQDQGLIVAVHDIRVPGTSANVDHVAVAASGIHVIDAKYYKNQQVEVVDRGGFLRRDVQLRVAKRNRTTLVDKLAKQILLVDSVTRDAELPTVVTPVLCFVHALWGVFKKEYELKGVHIVPPPRLERLLRRPGPLGADTIQRVGDLLRARLRPA